MKILETGKLPEINVFGREELPKERVPRKFKCWYCGCLFEAGPDEYKVRGRRDDPIAICICPYCKRMAYDHNILKDWLL